MHILNPFVLSVLLFIILHTPSPSAAADTLRRGDALAGSEKLVSANGRFALGFFQLQTGSSYLGIWFDKIPVMTPVWTANRDHPVSSSASPELTISSDGNMVLLDHQGTTIWSTRANITASDTVAVLLGSGNLVLRSSSNSSLTFWESFDYPTDTQLPGAKIGWNKVTGLNRKLVSRKNSVDLSSGIFSSSIDHDGVMRTFWNSSVAYWIYKWNGKFFSSVPEMSAYVPVTNFTFVNNDQEVYFSYNFFDESAITYIVMDVSGKKKSRVWTAQDWTTVTDKPTLQCDVYAVCGPFTVCTNKTSSADTYCNCMQGFSVRSPADWEIEDRTRGCIRNTPLNCGANKAGMADKFYSMPGIRLPQNGKIMPNVSSANECAQICLSNCSCTAYSYGKDGCFIWHGELLNVATGGNEETIYLRLAAVELESGKGNRSGMVIGVAIATTIVALVFILLIVIWRRNGKWSRPIVDNDQGSIGIIAFKYADLNYATNKFSDMLGTGGFGSVFKGCLSDSIAIAVKRLDGPQQGEKQFRAEVNSIGVIQHINLVKLVGFCCEGDRRLLVYELMPNGSLDYHLFQSNGSILDWNIRYQIALGVARALAYLHHGCRDCIIHCDIKPQNILLNSSFIPKVADFGMAKFLGRDFSRVVTTMRGTIGYLAPEWISGTPVTPKVDVYSYGMVLLEIISGKRNSIQHSCSDIEGQGDYFPVQVAHKLIHGDVLKIVDANLHGNANMEEVERVCKIACWCIQDREYDRPTMIEVVQFLEGICDPEIPPMPRLLHAIARSGSHQSIS